MLNSLFFNLTLVVASDAFSFPQIGQIGTLDALCLMFSHRYNTDIVDFLRLEDDEWPEYNRFVKNRFRVVYQILRTVVPLL